MSIHHGEADVTSGRVGPAQLDEIHAVLESSLGPSTPVSVRRKIESQLAEVTQRIVEEDETSDRLQRISEIEKRYRQISVAEARRASSARQFSMALSRIALVATACLSLIPALFFFSNQAVTAGIVFASILIGQVILFGLVAPTVRESVRDFRRKRQK